MCLKTVLERQIAPLLTTALGCHPKGKRHASIQVLAGNID